MQFQNQQRISVCFQDEPCIITVIQVYALTSNAKEAEVKQSYEDLQALLELTHKKDVLFITGDWNAKVESQKMAGVTGKLGLGVQNKAGQRLTVLPRKCTGHSNPSANNTRDNCTHRHHQMGNTEIRLIIFFVTKNGEALHSQQKQDRELTVPQIMNSLLSNSDLHCRK